jgi:hypothetical protein
MTIMQKKFRAMLTDPYNEQSGLVYSSELLTILNKVENKVTLFNKKDTLCEILQLNDGQVGLLYTIDKGYNTYDDGRRYYADREVRIFLFDTIEQFMFHMKGTSEISHDQIIDKLKGVVRDEFLVGYILTQDLL